MHALSLMLAFETLLALKEKKFPDIWKKANVVPVNKKENNLLKTIVLLSYSLFSAKYLKG